MPAMITGIICFILSIGAFTISTLSFREKGFLFNNSYLYASKEERAVMDKKPHYRQSAIIFLLIGIMFLLEAFSLFGIHRWFQYIAVVIAIIIIIYAIISSIIIDKQKN